MCVCFCCHTGSLLARCVNMDEKKFQHRVKEWFRQAAARSRNEISRDIEKTIVLELQRETETGVIETEPAADYFIFDATELASEELSVH